MAVHIQRKTDDLNRQFFNMIRPVQSVTQDDSQISSSYVAILGLTLKIFGRFTGMVPFLLVIRTSLVFYGVETQPGLAAPSFHVAECSIHRFTIKIQISMSSVYRIARYLDPFSFVGSSSMGKKFTQYQCGQTLSTSPIHGHKHNPPYLIKAHPSFASMCTTWWGAFQLPD